MPRFAANLSMLFTEVPFLDRFDRAARAGFESVEFLFPYDHPAEEVARAIRDAGVRLALHNLPAGNWAAGERGIACHPTASASSGTGSGVPSSTRPRLAASS